MQINDRNQNAPYIQKQNNNNKIKAEKRIKTRDSAWKNILKHTLY